MQKMKVVSLPLNEVISEIARAFCVQTNEAHGEYRVELPPEIGEGNIKGLNLDGGLGIIQYDCRFHEEMEIQFIVNKVHPLKFLYVTEGELHHSFENENKHHILHRFQNAIVASCNNHGHMLRFKKGMRTTVFSLEIDRVEFSKRKGHREDGMNARLKRLFADINASESFYYEGDYSLKMVDIFKKLDHFEGSEFLFTIFMESVAYQTLVQQISQYIDDQRETGSRSVLRRSEVDAIKKAAEYIDHNLATYRSMPELTAYTGLNAGKLQEGFKYLYSKTVNQYVHYARLNLAREQLIHTDDSISEIVYKIGLSSKSYFSRVFREEFGVSPSVFRRGLQRSQN